MKIKRIIGNTVLVIAWTTMAIVLAVAAALICTVHVLTPEHITPIVNNLANSYLNADVYLGRIELAFRPAFPQLHMRVDSVSVVSHAFRSMEPAQKAALPSYADTLLTLGSLSGSIDAGALLRNGTISLGDVQIVRPAINIVLAPDGTGNFDIYSSEPDSTESTPTPLPAFSLKRFAIEQPRAIRYFDAADSTEATVLLLGHAVLDGTAAPSYALHVSGRVHSPVARQLIQLDDLRVGLDGTMHWSPTDPRLVAVERFRLAGAFITATVDARVRMGQTLTIDTAAVDVDPVPLDSLTQFIDPAIRRRYGLTAANFRTDAAIAFHAHLNRPFVPETDTVPNASARITIAPAMMNYGRMRLTDISLDVSAILRGTDYDAAVVTLERFTAAGPATSVDISGTFGNLLSDPRFDCRMEGEVKLANLPPALVEKLEGYIDGHLKVNISATGRSSMFRMGYLHGLDVRGRAEATNLYYLSADTSKFVTADRATFSFGSQIASRDTSARANTLAAALRIDSAEALLGGVRLSLGDFSVGLGVENAGRSADTTMVVPMGGAIRAARFAVATLTDSAGAFVRGLRGRVRLARHSGDNHVPEILLDAGIDRLVAGAPAARVLLRDAHLRAFTFMKPKHERRRRFMRNVSHSGDSLRPGLQPAITPDSALARAIAMRMHRPKGPSHMRLEDDDEVENLQFEVSKGFRRYLTDWYLAGELSTERAMLATPYFPVRNRLEHMRLAFSTDSVIIDSLRYRGGSSDLAISGIVSNIKRVLAGRRGATVKVNFDISSDTIDVNELAAATFAGAAYAERLRRGTAEADGMDAMDDDSFERNYTDAVAASDTLAPLLVPVNVDANISVSARNIFYSDLHMHHFSGDLLVYDGAVNLSDLQAESDAGNIELSALYSAPRITDIRAGMGLKLTGFNIERFLNLVPAIDSIMPLMRDFAGTIDADIAATVHIDSTMNLELPTLDAAVYLGGTDLAFIDPETYRTIGKWLRFRDRADNRIKSMSVQLLVRNNVMQIYPFKFDIDRYTLGVVGSNDLAMNFDYHIAVLKSPLPFKFGVTVKGNPDKYKVRLGGAKFKADAVAENIGVVDTVRINLVRQIQGVFRRGVSRSRFASLDASSLGSADAGIMASDTLSRADSLALESQTVPADSVPPAAVTPKRRRKR